MGPTYIKDLLIVEKGRSGLRSNKDIVLEIPKTNLISCGNRAFCKAALYYGLPTNQIKKTRSADDLTSDITVKSSADLVTCLNGFKTSMEMKFDVLRSDLKEDLMKSVEDIVSNAVSSAIEREVQKLKIEIRKDMNKLSQRVLEIEKQQTDLSQKQTALKSSQAKRYLRNNISPKLIQL